MHKYIWKPAWWVLKHKIRPGKKYSMYENPVVCAYRDGKVSKDQLDALSTCDLCAVAKDGLKK